MNSNITYVYIETTNYCNLNCSFCNRNEVVKKLQHMSINNFKIILDKIKDNPIREAKLMGMGETFLHPKYHEICKLFKNAFPNTNLISSTNCQYKINDSFKESLKYIDMLYFSIDGYGETYEKYRSGAKWYKLIEYLEEFKNINRFNCKVVINYVINPNNILDIQKVYDDVLLKYNLEELRLNFAQNWTENEHMILDYTEEQIDYIKNNWSKNVMGKSNWNYSDCFWIKSGLYISVNGDVKICRLNTTSKKIGNIFNNNIEDIKKSKNFNDIKNACETNNPLSHCLKCSYKELIPILQKIKN